MSPSARSKAGRPIAIYRHRKTRTSELLLVDLPIALVATGSFFIALYLSFLHYPRYGRVPSILWSRPWYAISFVCLVILAGLLLRHLRLGRQYIAVYRSGLYLNLNHRQAMHWEDISGVSIDLKENRLLGRTIARRFQAVLFTQQGKKIPIGPGIQNLPDLITHIKAHIYPRLQSALEKSYLGGSWIRFGPISIHRQGFRLNSIEYPWNRVGQIGVQSGYLVVELKPPKKVRLPASQIPNLELLLEMIKTGVNA